MSPPDSQTPTGYYLGGYLQNSHNKVPIVNQLAYHPYPNNKLALNQMNQ